MDCLRSSPNRTAFDPVRDYFHLLKKESTMSDDLHNRGPQDRSRISLSEKWEVQYWTKELGISKEELERAVHAAGNSVNAVRQHLGVTKH
jgi:hypothetical protein